MKNAFSHKLLVGAAATISVLAIGFALKSKAETMPVADLSQNTHIHGLSVDAQDPTYLLIATHHGLFRAGADGKAERVSEVQDFMGFNPHPTEPTTLYASGHPAAGGNLGFIASRDSGKTWTQISPGVDGPVDFHQMTVSPADPDTIYGAYGELQVSRDAGETWSAAGPQPSGLIDLAASAEDADRVYAATETGLLVSQDAGETWNSLTEGAPVTLVETTREGTLYAYVIGRGLLKASEPPLKFDTVSDELEGTYLLHLAVDRADGQRLFGATGDGQVITSTDGGRSWAPLSGSGF